MEKSPGELQKEIQKNLIFSKLTLPESIPPKQAGFIRFVFASDTHEAAGWENNLPDGDVIIHCGDLTKKGTAQEAVDFTAKFEKLPHKIKIIIVGNHEIKNLEKIKEIVTQNINFIYLENSSKNILGYKIYGTPFYDWDFKYRERIVKIWNMIPDDTDILITHGPPLYFGDLNEGNEHSGCVDLLNTVKNRVKPKIHAFGHIHNDYGVWKHENTIYANATICDIDYKATRRGIVIDLPSKTEEF